METQGTVQCLFCMTTWLPRAAAPRKGRARVPRRRRMTYGELAEHERYYGPGEP